MLGVNRVYRVQIAVFDYRVYTNLVCHAAGVICSVLIHIFASIMNVDFNHNKKTILNR